MNFKYNKIGLSTIICVFLLNCSQNISKPVSENTENKTNTTINITKDTSKMKNKNISYSTLTEVQWRELLSSEDFNILRNKATESPNTGKYNNNKDEGIYICKGCGTELFSSQTKYESGSGWPAFYDEINNNVEKIVDNSHGMKRVEIVCKTCKGHLGHVFTDGPAPTGNRYCVNSASLDFKKKIMK